MNVSTGRVAKARELVHERYAHREHRLRGVLDELTRARVGHDDALARELQRRVERLASDLARLFAPGVENVIRSGRKKSCTAEPSLRNSGSRHDLDRHGAFRVDSGLDCMSHVPTGTVLFTTASADLFAILGDLVRGRKTQYSRRPRPVGSGAFRSGDEGEASAESKGDVTSVANRSRPAR